MVPLRKHWESTSVIGCSVFVVNHDWLQLQLQSKMAEVLMQSGPQVVFHTPRNIKVASCLILIVTIHVILSLGIMRSHLVIMISPEVELVTEYQHLLHPLHVAG